MPVTSELTLSKQENLSLNLRDEVDTVKIKSLVTYSHSLIYNPLLELFCKL